MPPDPVPPDLMVAGPPRPVDAVVGYEAAAPMCEAASVALLRGLEAADPRLAEFFPRTPILDKHVAIGDWLKGAATAESRRKRWEGAAPCRPFAATAPGGRVQGIAAVLLVAGSRLKDDAQRLSLAVDLTGAPAEVVRFLVVALDPVGDLLPSDERLAEAEVAKWAADFTIGGARAVTILVASAVLDDGRPVPPADVADAVACGLRSELVLPEEGNCLLLGDADDPRLRIGALGIRTLRYRPERVAGLLLPRAIPAVLDRTVDAEDDGALPRDTVPPPPGTFIEGLLPRGDPDGPRLVPLPDASGGDVRGKDFAFRIDMGRLTESARLESVPRTQWPIAIYAWDHVLRQGRLPVWLDRVGRNAGSVRDAALAVTRAEVAEAMGQKGANPRALRVIDTLSRRVSDRYAVTVDGAGTSSLDDDVAALVKALESIAHPASVALRAGGIVALALIAVWLFWGLPSSLIRWVGLGALAVVAIGAAGWGLKIVRASREAARRARDEALERCERRARLEIAVRVAGEVRKVQEALRADLAKARPAVEAQLGALAALRKAAGPDASDEEAAVLIDDLPAAEGLDRLWKEDVEPDLDSADEVSIPRRFGRFLVEETARVLRGETGAVPATLGERARACVRELVAKVLAKKRRLWHFLRAPGAGPLDGPDAERVREAVRRLLPDEGRWLAPHAAVRRAALHDDRTDHVVWLPAQLAGYDANGPFDERVAAQGDLACRVSVAWLRVPGAP